MLMKFIVDHAVFTEKQKGNQIPTMDTHIDIYIHIHTHIYIYIYTYAHTHIYIYVCVYMYIYKSLRIEEKRAMNVR